MRKAGDVIYADVDNKGGGVVEFSNPDDMDEAVRKLDDTEFKNPFDKCYVRVKLASKGNDRSPSRSRSRSRSHSPSRSRSRDRKRSYSRSRSPEVDGSNGDPEKPMEADDVPEAAPTTTEGDVEVEAEVEATEN
jgi:arginine/serine-rich splicing factor 1/9